MTNTEETLNQLIDRTLFSPAYARHSPYGVDAIDMGNGRWIQSTQTVSKIVQYLALNKSDKVLEIGCGSGYQAAILSQLCQKVVTLDCDKTLLKKADEIFDELNINNIQTQYVHKGKNWKLNEKFSAIVVSMAIEKVPNYWFEQLLEDGVLIAPIIEAENYHILTLFYKRDGRMEQESVEQVSFINMQDVIERCKEKSKYDFRFWL